MSNMFLQQFTRHSIFASKLRDLPVWTIITVDDSLIMTRSKNMTLGNQQKINKRREFWRLINDRKGKIFTRGIQGTLVKYEVRRGSVMCFAWKSDPDCTDVELRKKDSEMNGRLWTEHIPNFITNRNATEIVNKLSLKTNISPSVIRAISSVLDPKSILIESTSETRKRTENVLRRIQALDINDAKQMIFDQRQLNGSKKQYDLYF